MNWEWLQGHEALLIWLGALSLVSFIASILLIPMIVVRMDKHYFVRRRAAGVSGANGLLRWIMAIGKNLLGFLLFIAGFVMLFVPGQGLLTMLVGLTLMDFPGKNQLQIKVLRMKAVRRSLNWIRSRKGREDLIIP